MSLSDGPHNAQRPLLPVIVGIVIGVVALLFAMANDTWTAVYIPALPWRVGEYSLAFEARMWAIMLVSFALGSVLAVAAGLRILKSKGSTGTDAAPRVRQLEADLERVTRLLTLTQQKEKSDESTPTI